MGATNLDIGLDARLAELAAYRCFGTGLRGFESLLLWLPQQRSGNLAMFTAIRLASSRLAAWLPPDCGSVEGSANDRELFRRHLAAYKGVQVLQSMHPFAAICGPSGKRGNELVLEHPTGNRD
jgi:hypothetical protein